MTMLNEEKVRLSVVAPAYNEEAGIEDVVRSWVSWLEEYEPNYEIIICDDGSSDQTWSKLERLAAANLKIRNIRLKENRGAAVAHAAALQNSTGEWVLMIDSDGQFDIRDYSALCAKQKNTRADAVIGERRRKNNALLDNIGSWMSSLRARMTFSATLSDFSSVFKLIRGNIARDLHLDSTGFEIAYEITVKLIERQVPISTVSIQHYDRHAGISKLKFLNAAWKRYHYAKYMAMRYKMLKRNIIRNNSNASCNVIKGINWI